MTTNPRIWPTDEETLRLCIEAAGFTLPGWAQTIAAKARELQAEEAKRRAVENIIANPEKTLGALEKSLQETPEDWEDPLPAKPTDMCGAVAASKQAGGDRDSSDPTPPAGIAAASTSTATLKCALDAGGEQRALSRETPAPTIATTVTPPTVADPALTLPDGRPAWPFRLEDALRGEAVVTRGGENVVGFKTSADNVPLVGLLRGCHMHWWWDGRCYGSPYDDLFMLTPPAEIQAGEKAFCCAACAKPSLSQEVAKLKKCSNCGGIIDPDHCSFCTDCAYGAAPPYAPFDFDAARAGCPVCLADGTVVECEFAEGCGERSIRVWTPYKTLPHESTWSVFFADGTHPLGVRLYMAPEKQPEKRKVTRWLAVNPDGLTTCLYNSEEAARLAYNFPGEKQVIQVEIEV